jgi:hypothetical protein
MEVILLVLALLLLGIGFAYWRKRRPVLKVGVFQRCKPSPGEQSPEVQSGELGLHPLPDLSLLSPITEQQDFSELKSQLEELAKRGWAKDEPSWYPSFSLSPDDLANEIAPAQVVEILLAHARRVAPKFSVPQMVPRTVIESTPFAAGQFEVDEEGWVAIKVSSDFFDDRLAAQAILAHEACHYILENSGIRQYNFALNERYTDLCMFTCGFGQIFLAGYKREPAQNQYRPGHRLGYLTDAEYTFANQYVLDLREAYKLKLQSQLDIKKKQLRQLVHGDEAMLKRLVDYERSRSPNKSEVELYEAAIDRLQRDR